MISIEQIKAARGLLDWTQDELAQASSVSLPTIKNIEQRLSIPRVNTMQAIQAAFEKSGVEFLDNTGLRFSSNRVDVRILEGRDNSLLLWQDIADSLKPGGERLIMGMEARMFESVSDPRAVDILRKTEEKQITGRVLLAEGNRRFIDPTVEYRWISGADTTQLPYYIYDDKVAILLWEPLQRVIRIENKALADAYRKHFHALWAKAIIPPFKFKVKSHA